MSVCVIIQWPLFMCRFLSLLSRCDSEALLQGFRKDPNMRNS